MDVKYARKHAAEDIAKMMYCLMEYAEKYINCNSDLGALDTSDAGAIIDMIKDLADAEKNCEKACYYKTVTAAMKNSDYEYRLGYIPEMDSEYGLYYDGDDEDFQNAEKWRKSKRMRNGIRAEEELDPRYGKSFNDYRKAKKYYTETHSTESKHRMDQDAENHLSESIDAFKEIWVDADPDLKQHIKSELSSLISSMVI